MRKSLVLLCLLLLLVSVLSFSAEVEEYEIMTNTHIVETFLGIYQWQEGSYQNQEMLWNALGNLAPMLQEISIAQLTVAEKLLVIETFIEPIKTGLQDYEQAVNRKIRDLTVQVYLVSAVGILSALLIAFLT